MTKKNGKLTFTILSISPLTVMAGAAMTPALGVIRSHFANQSSLMVQLIVSLPALTIIITNLFFPLLCRLMRTRTIAVSGLCMYLQMLLFFICLWMDDEEYGTNGQIHGSSDFPHWLRTLRNGSFNTDSIEIRKLIYLIIFIHYK